jgi:hypothetical protein
VLPALASIRPFREWRFRSVSQIAVNYRDGALSAGRAGKVEGGDRLPWVGPGVSAGGAHDIQGNHAPLAEIGWQVHVYGAARAEIAAWAHDNHVSLHQFAFTSAHAKAGLKESALYLIRPDTYIALASERPSAEELQRYFTERGMKPALLSRVTPGKLSINIS